MDTITHIVVGACMGEALGGRQLGKKALLLGALAQSIPDIDFIATFWLPLTRDLLAHRGFTHSILFCILSAILLAFISQKIFRGKLSFSMWVVFWGLQSLFHILLDSFNAYGTGWLLPFSNYRVAFHTMYVADPLFSLWPALAFAALLLLHVGHQKRVVWIKYSLLISGIYLLTGILFKQLTSIVVSQQLTAQGIKYNSFLTTPTPLNNMLWYVVAKTDSGYYSGYRSVWDGDKPIAFHYDNRNTHLLSPFEGRSDIADLLQFSEGYYTVEQWHDTTVLNVLRFGEIAGWAEPHPKKAFYYFLQHPADNDLLVQRGRFAKWDKHLFFGFLKRIGGS